MLQAPAVVLPVVRVQTEALPVEPVRAVEPMSPAVQMRAEEPVRAVQRAGIQVLLAVRVQTVALPAE